MSAKEQMFDKFSSNLKKRKGDFPPSDSAKRPKLNEAQEVPKYDCPFQAQSDFVHVPKVFFIWKYPDWGLNLPPYTKAYFVHRAISSPDTRMYDALAKGPLKKSIGSSLRVSGAGSGLSVPIAVPMCPLKTRPKQKISASLWPSTIPTSHFNSASSPFARTAVPGSSQESWTIRISSQENVPRSGLSPSKTTLSTRRYRVTLSNRGVRIIPLTLTPVRYHSTMKIQPDHN